ncbi:hypothetical protein MXM82_15360 [Pseudomonas asiatica]|uniref:hypothetical protein n=1 Tax=Pseudomonas asiatica TaxID=2219225 RepID=UPI002DBF56C1|nr:hypothetical protein [Pseudomonas asiatica]MEB6590506.1 hypothetical protein [Pseudomonas asiatica]
MLQSFAFKNRDGLHGIFQKEGDIVHYHVANHWYPIRGCSNWSQWRQQVEGGYRKGEIDSPSAESISYYLLRYAETINHEVAELAPVSKPGFYYPRINRGNIGFNYVSDAYHLDVRAYRNIQASLDGLFDVIEPSARNFGSYGHKIRELLIIACTEVEFLLLKALTDNGYTKKTRYTTSDYANCLDLFRLDQWKVELNQYPAIKTFMPFKGWDKGNATKSLPWYNAYNAVKHNRGDNIADANFEHALDAVAALHILLEAQYGRSVFDKISQRSEERSLFMTVVLPSWLPSEMSVPILRNHTGETHWVESQEYFLVNPLPSQKPERQRKPQRS